MTKAAERTTPYTFITQSFDALMAAIMAPAGGPISPPTPRIKPKPGLEKKPALKPGIVAECGAATIVSKLAADGESLVYRATFAPDMIDNMVEMGCGQFYQGCNICSVRYDECDAKEKALCKTSDCLERTCTRKVVCSSKVCMSRGREPNCKSRLARAQCRKSMFE